MDDFLNRISWYQHLLTKSSSFWIDLINKYMISKPKAVVKGVPSKARAKALQAEEKRRVSRRSHELGRRGLNQLAREAEAARLQNGVRHDGVNNTSLLDHFNL